MPSMDLPRRSLRTQIALVFGGFAALLAISLCLLAGEILKLRLQQQAAKALHIVANNTATMLQQDLQQQSRRTQVLAASKELWQQGLASESVAEMLARVQHINPYSVWIGIADTHGVVRNATDHLLLGADVSKKPWFEQAQKGPFIGEVHDARLPADLLPRTSSGEPLRLIDFASPIHRPDGSLLGVLGIHSNWDWVRDAIERLLQGAAQSHQQSIFIFDQQGALIYAPQGDATRDAQQEQILPPGLEDNLQPHVTTWKDSSDLFLTSAVRLTAPSEAHDLGWWIVARQPVQAAYADANRILWFSLGFAAIAGLCAAVAAWYLARHVSNDLKLLAQAVGKIEDYTHAADIPLLRSNREVFKLSQALSTMTGQLLRANEEMQEQVRLRTLELQAANAKLVHQANTDPLTRLLNRRGFHTQAGMAVALARRSSRPLSAIALDIDFFKKINDLHGHDVGDKVLATVASVLQQRMRKADMVARLGGEEFVVLLPDTDAQAAQQVALALLHAVAHTDMAPAGTVTLSAGVSSLRHQDAYDDLDGLLKRSDAGLYQAKHSGRNRVVAQT